MPGRDRPILTGAARCWARSACRDGVTPPRCAESPSVGSLARGATRVRESPHSPEGDPTLLRPNDRGPSATANPTASPASRRTPTTDPGQQPGQQRQDRPIGGYRVGSTHLATQYPELMTQDRDLNLVLGPRTQPPAEHINHSTDQGIEEPQEHDPQPAPTGHGRLKTPFRRYRRSGCFRRSMFCWADNDETPSPWASFC